MSHQHYQPSFWSRCHSEAVVLDIGGEVGALVLFTPQAMHRQEIEISPVGNTAQRTHAAVLQRRVNGRTTFAAVYPELRAGQYYIWDGETCAHQEVTITPAAVAEAHWTDRP